jgi:hypothetical protein
MQPLADLLRPTSLSNYIGQSHLVGPHAPLRLAMKWPYPLHDPLGATRVRQDHLAKIASSVGADFHYLLPSPPKRRHHKNISC